MKKTFKVFAYLSEKDLRDNRHVGANEFSAKSAAEALERAKPFFAMWHSGYLFKVIETTVPPICESF